jgi:hypothetical protein
MRKMKYILIFGFALLLMASTVAAQETGTGKNFKFTIKTNPLSALGGPFWVAVIPITGEYKLLFETALTQKMSGQIGLGYIGPSVLINLDDLTSTGSSVSGIKTSGVRVQGMLKFFLSRDLPAPKGFYVGPHLSYATASLKSKDNPTDKISAQKINVNGVIGYQMITSGGFCLDIYTGMGFVSRKWTVSGSTFDVTTFKDKSSVSIPFGMSFGYAF